MNFQGFQKQASDFFWEMRFHNDRSWFYEHKEEYDALIGTPMKLLGQDSFELLLQRFPEMDAKLHISRIWRDARRLYGRGPLKENLWFSIERADLTAPSASFFFELEPATFSYGLGFWTLKTEQMERFRRSIDANPAAFERLAKKVAWMKGFAPGGELYRRPKGDYGPIVNEWYNRKWTNIVHEEVFGGDLLTPELPQVLADAFTALMPMHDYLIEHTIL